MVPRGVAWRILILRAYGRQGGLVWARHDEGQRDRDTIERWAEENLRSVDWALPGPRTSEKPGVIEHQPLGVNR
jgi:hypothetical protein